MNDNRRRRLRHWLERFDELTTELYDIWQEEPDYSGAYLHLDEANELCDTAEGEIQKAVDGGPV